MDSLILGESVWVTDSSLETKGEATKLCKPVKPNMVIFNPMFMLKFNCKRSKMLLIGLIITVIVIQSGGLVDGADEWIGEGVEVLACFEAPSEVLA